MSDDLPIPYEHDDAQVINEVWDKQSSETDHAYRAFSVYRDLGYRRSLRKCGDAYFGNEGAGVTPSQLRQLQTWSADNKWVLRAQAYDDWEELERRIVRFEAIRDMEVRHAKMALAMQNKALLALKLLSPEDIKPADLVRFFVEASKLERLARGEATDRTEITGAGGGSIKIEAEPTDRDRLAALTEALLEAGILSDPLELEEGSAEVVDDEEGHE